MVELHGVPASGHAARPVTPDRRRARLCDEADAVRAEMALLRREIAATGNGLTDARAARLLEVNEQLVARALAALALATAAARDQAGLTGPGQRDGLTGTPNRALMLDRLRVAIGSARRRGAGLTVLALRLDALEDINEAFGRSVGDAALQLVAGRLESAVRDSDTVCRYGMDLFVVLLCDLGAGPDARATARRLLSALTLPARIADRALQLTASLGAALYPMDGDDAAALIARANAALSPAGTGDGMAFEQRVGAPGSAAAARAPVAASPAGVEEAQRRQLDFLALVAHELRNPLAPIRLAAEVLARDRRDDPLMARQQAIITRQIAHMSRLIEDLLDGSRIRTGNLRLDRRTVEMAEVLRLAVETCRPAIDQRAQELTVGLPDAPCCVIGDPVRLVQVFSNLLGNAAKYTPAGGTLGVTLAQAGDRLTISVADTGIGIAADALPGIFGLFVQDTRAQAFDSRGMGIGLALVRHLVEAHGGSVVGASAGPGLGSEFVVTLPLTTGPRAIAVS
jgi:diguanylate cyclase (GGDEF)-like protein